MPPLAALDGVRRDLTHRRFLASAAAGGLLTACATESNSTSTSPASGAWTFTDDRAASSELADKYPADLILLASGSGDMAGVATWAALPAVRARADRVVPPAGVLDLRPERRGDRGRHRGRRGRRTPPSSEPPARRPVMPIALLGHRVPIEDHATRREFLIGGLSLAALLAGCAGSTTEAPPAPGAAGFPLILVGEEGTATIPALPQRVITVGFQRDTDTALALGVTPVAMARHFMFPSGIAPWVEPALTGPMPELLDTTKGMPFERIAGLRPDLILATDDFVLPDNYARLTRIAPTVSYVDGVESDTWQQRTTHIGKALGRDEEAKQVIAVIEAKIMRAARANPAFAGKTFSRSYAYERKLRTMISGDASVALLEQLGLKISPEVAALPQADTPGRATVSPENLDVLDADVMLISYPTAADRAFLESSPLFQQLDAVRNGTYILLDNSVSPALGFPSALSIPYGLDRTVAAVTEVLT
ncbi:MAG: iron-siderophore ABC transporter substrate-binding protein [Pseudonocardia sp.]